MIRAVLFDFDETLVNSLDTFWEVFNHAATGLGLAAAAKDRIATGLSRGWDLAAIIADIYPQLNGAGIESALTAIHHSLDELLPRFPITLKPETMETLAAIKAAGLKIGLVTARNMSAAAMTGELDSLGIGSYFDCVITGLENTRKPSPDGIHASLKKLGLAPEEAVLVGDAEADIIAGREAGVPVVLLANGTHHLAKLPHDGAAAVIGNLNELPGYLKLNEGG